MTTPPNASRAVTVLVTRRVAPEHVAGFEDAMAGMMEAARRFPGHLGSQLIRPGEPGSSDEPLLHHVVFAFDDEAHLAGWQDSPERAHWLARLAPHTVGAQETHHLTGLDYWFTSAGGTSGARPPRWKVAVVTWLGIFPIVLFLFVTVAPLMADWPLVPRTLVFTALVVILMTWLVAPRLTRALAGWLNAAAPGAAPR